MAIIKKYVQGELIKAEDHNLTQRNGVIFSKPVYSVVSGASVYALSDFVMEQEIFEGLKLKLLIDTDSVGEEFSIKIKDTNYPLAGKFQAGNVYNLVCIKTINDLNQDIFSFIIEKSGGGLKFTTIIDQDVEMIPSQGITPTGILIPAVDYNLINIVLSYQSNYGEELVLTKTGVLTSKDLINRHPLVNVNTVASNAIKCEPLEQYGDFQVYIYIKENQLYFYSPYGFQEIVHIKIEVM